MKRCCAVAGFLLMGLAVLGGACTRSTWAGNEVPTPFKDANLKVELADGEYYVLEGRVRSQSGTTFLEVDLERHHWLSNKHRSESPFYPLFGDAKTFAKYEGRLVRMMVIARARMRQQDNRFYYSIWLDPQAEPKEIVQAVRRRN
jgi:hypothetical protein